jgi:DNA-binding FrmR family transcriptional regulator
MLRVKILNGEAVSLKRSVQSSYPSIHVLQQIYHSHYAISGYHSNEMSSNNA